MKRNCERAMIIDYGLKILHGTDLKIANTEDFHWLLQAELKAIKEKLIYVEEKFSFEGKYRGYVNRQGQRQGVGILIQYTKYIGEWHEDLMHGIAKIEYSDGSSCWGKIKHD